MSLVPIHPIEKTSDILDKFFNFDGKKLSDNIEFTCPSCHREMTKRSEYELGCTNCKTCLPAGNTGEHHTIGACENHNTSSNAYMSFKPVGGGSGKNKIYMNTMIKYTSEYQPLRDNKILAVMRQYNYICDSISIPENILREAASLFIDLTKDDVCVYRGLNRRGIFGGCIKIQCDINNIAKTNSIIAKVMDVEESNITNGLDEIYKLAKLNGIVLPDNKDPTIDYINNYFETFDLDQSKKQFAIDLLARAAKKQIEEINRAHYNSRCIGVTYFVCKHFGWEITHKQIAANCENISPGTYQNIYKAILNNQKKLNKVFIRHNVHLPQQWSIKK